MHNTELVHADDPQTSFIAADALSDEQRREIKGAIIMLLSEHPRTVSELTREYFTWRRENHWPGCKPDSIAKRVSELVNAGQVHASGKVTGDYGRPVNVWAVAL